MTPKKPFILQDYKITNDKINVKTDQGSFSFELRPSSLFYTAFNPKTKGYTIYYKEDLNEEEKEACIVHELCHYDYRVICPAYSTGRFIASKFPMPKVVINPIINLDNLFEDHFSKPIIMLEFFSERIVKKCIKPFSAVIGAVKLLSEFTNIDFKTEELIKSTVDIAKEMVEEIESDIEELSDIEERLNKAYVAYEIIDDISHLIFESIKQNDVAEFTRKKLSAEIDPFWCFRWQLELFRIEQSDIDTAWEKAWLNVFNELL